MIQKIPKITVDGIGHGMNPFSNMLRQQSEDIDNVIKDLEKAVAAGHNPNIFFEDVLRKNGVRSQDLSEFDKDRIKRKVESAMRAKRNNR